MHNRTFMLPDDLVQHAEAYAAEHGTTMTALVCEHLEHLTGYQARPPLPQDALAAFSEGRISKEAAIRALGLRDHAQPLLLLGEHGLPLLRLAPQTIEAMTETLVRAYQSEQAS